jgi:hypothetical protein
MAIGTELEQNCKDCKEYLRYMCYRLEHNCKDCKVYLHRTSYTSMANASLIEGD